MDLNLIRSLLGVIAFASFLGIGWWAYAPSRRERFERDDIEWYGQHFHVVSWDNRGLGRGGTRAQVLPPGAARRRRSRARRSRVGRDRRESASPQPADQIDVLHQRQGAHAAHGAVPLQLHHATRFRALQELAIQRLVLELERHVHARAVLPGDGADKKLARIQVVIKQF